MPISCIAAARRSWGPSRGIPWLLGGSEDPWLCVPDFGQVCLCRLFVVVPLILRVARQVLIVNITRLVQATGNVGYGSAADPQKSSTPGAAFERDGSTPV